MFGQNRPMQQSHGLVATAELFFDILPSSAKSIIKEHVDGWSVISRADNSSFYIPILGKI